MPAKGQLGDNRTVPGSTVGRPGTGRPTTAKKVREFMYVTATRVFDKKTPAGKMAVDFLRASSEQVQTREEMEFCCDVIIAKIWVAVAEGKLTQKEAAELELKAIDQKRKIRRLDGGVSAPVAIQVNIPQSVESADGAVINLVTDTGDDLLVG